MKNVIIGLFLCVALLATTLGCGTTDHSRIDAQMGVSALVALADSHIEGYVNSMDALAVTEEVRSAQWDNMVELLKVVEDTGTGGIVWFVLPDGSYYTVDQGLTDQNLSDRDYFEALMDGNRVLGSLVFSKATGKASVIAAVPVTRENALIGAIGCSIFLEELSTRLASDIGLPDDMVFWATNPEGEVALHSDSAMVLNEDAELPEDGVSKTSPLTNWQFTLAFEE